MAKVLRWGHGVKLLYHFYLNCYSLTVFSGPDRVGGVAVGQCREPGEEAEGPGGLLGHSADPGDGVQPHAPL